ncbi:L,D-transpeptidase family protein [uncultured Alsobacter sp.]|uniref:L,D-transpeptidase family protein n=1 Tax=uncultured Alsobacter sp. TaxID=1748258 RepID=UPI0025E00383|nr:L,D-transpeptidase family protein [uncultured Alsobacter sp.]
MVRARPLTLRVFRLPSDPRRGILVAGALVLPCALGRGGIRRAKREGDGATPAGPLRPMAVRYRPDRTARPRARLPVGAIRPTDGWCDDPRHPRYNRPVPLPFPAGHERLHRADAVYDVVVILDWNMRPAIRGRGSAIFLHLARPGFTPTEGCIAVSPAAMRRLLPLLGRSTRIVVAG